jgi:hypothetical protein
VNCRFGPGVAGSAIALNSGQSSQIVGKNSTNEWWYIQIRSTRDGTVGGSERLTLGNLANVPIVQILGL